MAMTMIKPILKVPVTDGVLKQSDIASFLLSCVADDVNLFETTLTGREALLML